MKKIYLNLLLLSLLFPLTCMGENPIVIDSKSIYDWPDIVMFDIHTETGADPTYTPVVWPGTSVPVAITDNNYVQGNLRIWSGHTLIYNSATASDSLGMKIKIRGNTTAIYRNQKPYKIKLTKKCDLFQPDSGTKPDKEWCLLGVGTQNTSYSDGACSILPIVGHATAEAAGIEWTPRCEFVNVVLNGVYKGCYILTDAISRSSHRIDLPSDGLLVENDQYWWNETAYFRTDRQLKSGMGTTFKYPDEDNLTESYLSGCTTCFNKAEQALTDTAQIETYIDFPSFARWLLIHDILGSGDVQGSNMYMYMTNFDPEGNSCTPIHMATPWDFDGIFYVGTDELAPIRNSNVFYYPELCRNPDFLSEYRRQWYSLRDGIYSCIEKKLKGFESQSAAIDSSLELTANHALMYPATPLKTQISETLALLQARLNTVDQNVRVITTGISTLYPVLEESSQPIYMRWDGTRLSEEYCKGKQCVRKTGRGGQTVFIVP